MAGLEEVSIEAGRRAGAEAEAVAEKHLEKRVKFVETSKGKVLREDRSGEGGFSREGGSGEGAWGDLVPGMGGDSPLNGRVIISRGVRLT